MFYNLIFISLTSGMTFIFLGEYFKSYEDTICKN